MDWIQFTIALCSVLALLGGGIVGLIKVGMMIASLRREVTPNGGNTSSLGDRMVKVERTLQRHGEELDKQTHTLQRIESNQRRPRQDGSTGQ